MKKMLLMMCFTFGSLLSLAHENELVPKQSYNCVVYRTSTNKYEFVKNDMILNEIYLNASKEEYNGTVSKAARIEKDLIVKVSLSEASELTISLFKQKNGQKKFGWGSKKLLNSTSGVTNKLYLYDGSLNISVACEIL